MRSSASLLLLLAACGRAPAEPRDVRAQPPGAMRSPPPDVPPPPEVASATGPAGTSGAGTEGYDAVGYASWYGEDMNGARTATGDRFNPAAVTAAHRTLPLGSIAEVTSLDTGRTILVWINDRGPGRGDREIDLSRGAADQLGVKGAVIAVRVRGVVASPADLVALKSGQRAASRLDAPPALLAALRRGLNRPYVAPPPPRPTTAIVPGPARTLRPDVRHDAKTPSGRYSVQVATLSNEARARALARVLDGTVQQAGALWRIRTGPYRDLTAAKLGRDAAARRGYGDARILTDP